MHYWMRKDLGFQSNRFCGFGKNVLNLKPLLPLIDLSPFNNRDHIHCHPLAGPAIYPRPFLRHSPQSQCVYVFRVKIVTFPSRTEADPCT